jgi:hypothetical protein
MSSAGDAVDGCKLKEKPIIETYDQITDCNEGDGNSNAEQRYRSVKVISH